MQAETLSERERPRGAGGRRPLVDFIVIGAMRAGTTMLHDLLSGHPQISMARMKETDFFVAEKNLPRGTGWYGAQFDPARPIRGEISPNYAKAMDFPGVPERIFEHCPGVRLVYVLRDPVARAVSQYAHSWNMGELSDTPEQMARGPEYPRILDASRYARQIDNYLRLFDPGQLLVVDFDALLADPQGQVDRILAHVGAEPMVVPPPARQNGNDELSRVPKPLLRLTQSRLRPLLTAVAGPALRGRLRRLLARGPARVAPAFPELLLQRMRDDLAEDAQRLRQMTGQEFARWSI